jgi:hypothetical protein
MSVNFIGGFDLRRIAYVNGDSDKSILGRRTRTFEPALTLVLETISLRHQIALLKGSTPLARGSGARTVAWILLSRWWWEAGAALDLPNGISGNCALEN